MRAETVDDLRYDLERKIEDLQRHIHSLEEKLDNWHQQLVALQEEE